MTHTALQKLHIFRQRRHCAKSRDYSVVLCVVIKRHTTRCKGKKMRCHCAFLIYCKNAFTILIYHCGYTVNMQLFNIYNAVDIL